jgi:hypothetical protein
MFEMEYLGANADEVDQRLPQCAHAATLINELDGGSLFEKNQLLLAGRDGSRRMNEG